MKPVVFLFMLLASLAVVSSAGKGSPPISPGLAWDFYKSSCPKVENLVRSELKKALKKDIGLAAALLRIHFHDCFVQGCDASVLLAGPGSEQDAPPNLTLRPAAFELINAVRGRVHERCGRVVSCADVTTLLARESVHLSGGPKYPVPLGRRDGTSFATRDVTLASLPAPSSDTQKLIEAVEKLNLDVNDLVALSGAHTIGIGHCRSFETRLYPTQDSTLNQFFANSLKHTCPSLNVVNTTVLDLRTPDVFDNKYYVNLMNRQGLFTSDQDLYTDQRTKQIVLDFALDQKLFFKEFALSIIKMGQLSVLTGSQGEIRSNCSAVNGGNGDLLSVVDGESILNTFF